MTTHISGRNYQIQASENLTNAKFKVITLAGTVAQAADKQGAGICISACGSNQNATAMVHGIGKAYVGGAVSTVGYPLKVANSGFLVVSTSGDLSCARALAVAASGDLLEVFFDGMTLHHNGAV